VTYIRQDLFGYMRNSAKAT